MRVSNDRLAHVFYMVFNEGEHGFTQVVDSSRFVHYLKDGTVHSVEFLYTDHGVSFSEMPIQMMGYLDEIARQMEQQGIKVFDHIKCSGGMSLPQSVTGNASYWMSR